MVEPAKQEVVVSTAQRGFGLGFGAHHQISVYTQSGPKTGDLLSDEQCRAVRHWAFPGIDKDPDTRRITDLIPPKDLVGALQNRLLHADTIEMVRLLPKILAQMSPPARQLLFDQPIATVRSEMWQELAETRPHLLQQGFSVDNPQAYFRRIITGGAEIKIAPGNDDILFNGVSIEAAATLLPILFEALDKEAQQRAAIAINEALYKAGEDKKFFAPLVDPNLNRLIVLKEKPASLGPVVDIINNGRTLMLRSPHGPKLRFQGDTYISSNLHFHPLKNADLSTPKDTNGQEDAKPEFMRYRDAKHEALCQKEPHLDPNKDVVGQLHSIFVVPDESGKPKRAMLLGADVVIGKSNKQLGSYIDFLKKKRAGLPLQIIPDASDADDVAAKKVAVDPVADSLTFNPLACYNEKFDKDGVPEAPFMSLHLGGLQVNSLDDVQLKPGKNSVFYRGVRVIHLPEPITISKDQLKDLRELQPTLMPVAEEACVHPRPRFVPGPERFVDIQRSAGVQSRALY